jgi:hypothetical protein
MPVFSASCSQWVDLPVPGVPVMMMLGWVRIMVAIDLMCIEGLMCRVKGVVVVDDIRVDCFSSCLNMDNMDNMTQRRGKN